MFKILVNGIQTASYVEYIHAVLIAIKIADKWNAKVELVDPSGSREVIEAA